MKTPYKLQTVLHTNPLKEQVTFPTTKALWQSDNIKHLPKQNHSEVIISYFKLFFKFVHMHTTFNYQIRIKNKAITSVKTLRSNRSDEKWKICSGA